MKISMISLKNIFLGSLILSSSALFAGNEDRVGSAGASHLLVNPWARSSAMGDASIAN